MPNLTDELSLREYESSDPVALTDQVLAGLRTLPADRISVHASDRSGWYVVRASSWVGSIVLPGLTIRITPKVQDLTNVFMMLGSAVGLEAWTEDHVPYRRADLLQGIAELVLREIESATRRGLVRGYQGRQERMPVIRGRLMVERLASRPWEVWPAPCDYAEFTGDIAENRVFRSVVVVIHRWAVDPALRRQAAVILSRLDEVTDVATPLLELDRVVRTRVNEHYLPALALCRIVLEGVGVSHLPGGEVAYSFLVNMNVLFERWIGSELTHRLWPGIEVVEQAPVPLSSKPRVMMAPDLLFKVGTSVSLVADVKYKLTSTGFSRNEDYYQLLAYATALRLRRGVLIYCQADEAPPREIRVIGGDQRLLCHSLSLAGGPADVAVALDDLASTVREWCLESATMS